MESKLPAVARGEFQLDNRMLLYAHVLGHDGWEGHALNDVVVTKGRLQQALISAFTAMTFWWSITGAMV